MELFVRDPAITYDDLQQQTSETFRREWEQWHRQREAYMTEPYGWLSLVSIDWLSDGADVQLDNFPGLWHQTGDTVVYTPAEGAQIVNDGTVLDGPKHVSVPGEGDFNLEDFSYGRLRAQLIKRIGSDRKFAVRVRDPHSHGIKEFQGIPSFEPSQRWVLPAHYEAAEQYQDVTVEAVDEGLTHNETTIGTLHVTIEGRDYALAVFQAHNDDSAQTRVNPETGQTEYLNNRANIENSGHFYFRDSTSGKESYGGARVVGFSLEEPDTISYVDFNRSMNLPCAFTTFCTCPLAPPQNTLAIPVLAGEKTPRVSAHKSTRILHRTK